MKILFLNRSKKFGGFSFEELFFTIKNNLTDCKTNDFYDKTYSSFWKNLKAVKKIESDLIHITGGIGYYALFLPTHKTILTVHDTNHYELDLKGFKKWIFGLIYYKIPIANVRKVTVVSDHTKNNLIRLFNIKPDKIKVIYNCYAEHFKTAKKNSLDETPNILHIGTKTNKNLITLIHAVKDIKIKLTIIGKLPLNIENLLNELNIKYINKFNLSHSEIYDEYLNCDIVNFTSLCEGFGLPIIEANIIGRPVITSNISPMKEVAGNEACLVDPNSDEEIKNAINKIIGDSSYRNQLIKNGIENAKNYSPEKIAHEYFNLYQSIFG